MFEVMSLRLDTGSQPWPPLFNSLVQCFPTFFQPGHTYLEPLTRRHTTAFLTLIMYMCVCVYRLKHQGKCDSYLAKSVQLCDYNSSFNGGCILEFSAVNDSKCQRSIQVYCNKSDH